MTPAWAHCPTCTQPLYPRTARRSEEGWVCADRMGCGRVAARHRNNAARAEDLAWMAETGETPDGAAHRLGLNTDALQKWSERNAPQTWARLVGNRKGRAA